MNLLEVRNLSKHFAGLKAVDGLSFTVAKGELLGVIGPNGAGKSTLFGLLSGFITPTAGQILFKGRDISGKPPDQLVKIGLVRTFQLQAPFGSLTVFENVLVASSMAEQNGRIDCSAAQHADRVLHDVHLSHMRNELARNLPQGDLKRLEIARAIGSAPELLLLDEPFGGVSQQELEHQMDLIRSLHRSGMTIILVEHVLKAVMPLSQRLLVLDYGTLLLTGDPVTVSRHPRVIEAYLGEETEHVGH